MDIRVECHCQRSATSRKKIGDVSEGKFGVDSFKLSAATKKSKGVYDRHLLPLTEIVRTTGLTGEAK
jgi:hypothetical protein